MARSIQRVVLVAKEKAAKDRIVVRRSSCRGAVCAAYPDRLNLSSAFLRRVLV
jgi:hypothetical protein